MKKVDFKRIEIENFLSIGNNTVDVDFQTGLNIITGVNLDKEDSKNGVGKTTIADALYFCLFGTTIRELKKEDIINNINQKKCRVKLEFDVSENKVTKKFVLERFISPNKVYLEENGIDKTKSSMPKTTAEICRIIGASPEVFKNAVIMTVNGTVPFMAQKKVEKRKFCEGLFNLGVFQDMLLEGRKRYNETKRDIEIEKTKKEEVEKTLVIYQEQDKKKTEYRVARTTKLLGRKQDNINELKELEGSIVEIKLDDILEFESNIELLETKRESIQNDTRKCIRSIATKEEQIKTKERDIDSLNEFGDMCDKCKRPFTENDKNSRNEKIASINAETKTIGIDIINLTNKQAKLEDQKEKCIKAIERQKKSIREINTSVEKNKSVTARIDQLTSWNKQIKIDIDALEEDKNEFTEVLDDTTSRLDSLKTALTELNKRLVILDSVKHIVSEEGVKSFIIVKLLKILNGKLAYYLTKLDAPCKFKFNEYFDERIINEKGKECSYHNFSSGEKKRIDLAILFTFMDIRRLQGNTATNIAFYDEILDTSLDDKGVEAFLEIVNERVEKYNEACYIISHKNAAIKAATNDVVFLKKKNGFTTLGNLAEEEEFLRGI